MSNPIPLSEAGQIHFELKPDFDGAQAETFKSFTTDLTTIDAF
jgi:hypothetical protein